MKEKELLKRLYARAAHDVAGNCPALLVSFFLLLALSFDDFETTRACTRCKALTSTLPPLSLDRFPRDRGFFMRGIRRGTCGSVAIHRWRRIRRTRRRWRRSA